MVRLPWETRAGSRSRCGPLGSLCDRPPGGTLDHQPQHFSAIEFDVFGEDSQGGDVEGASVILGLSGVAPTLQVAYRGFISPYAARLPWMYLRG